MTDNFENSKNAALAVIYFAVIDARQVCYYGSKDGITPEESRRLAELMDVIHNLPNFIAHWSDFDEERFIEELRWYDTKWKSRLTEEYLRVRTSGAAQTSVMSAPAIRTPQTGH